MDVALSSSPFAFISDRYTDETFKVRKERSAEWEHLGLLGPALRAQVGDWLEVTFKNNARFPFSIHPSGARASKSNEGAHYSDGTAEWKQRDDWLDPFGVGTYTCPPRSEVVSREKQEGCSQFSVTPGRTFTYLWDVSEAAGPQDSDGSSVAWLYQSHASDTGEADLNAGLMGPIIVSRPGTETSEGDFKPNDVDREFVVMFSVSDENKSPYASANFHSRVVEPALAASPGRISFAHLDKARVLQALYAHATNRQTLLDYDEASTIVEDSIAAHERVGSLHSGSVTINVWFTQDTFDPSAYDAVNGGSGSARSVLAALVTTLVDPEDGGFQEGNMMHHMNGRVMCNLGGLNMVQGETVRWHLFSVGSEVDVHTPHWHGHTALYDGFRIDQLDMLPGSAETVDMEIDNVGSWLFHCHVNDHITGGMAALYHVSGTDESFETTGSVREYYVAAEEVEWDYAPGGVDQCAGGSPFTSTAQKTLDTDGVDSIGRTVTKAVFVEYTDATYTTVVARATEDDYLGIMGPILRGAVGDTILVHFRNNAQFPFSLHPHGVLYGKDAEGLTYNDGTTGDDRADDSVAPGTEHTYEWAVPERAGPGPNDPSSIVWMYHSHVSEVNDTNAGLVGPIVVTRAGASDEDAHPTDVDRELFFLFTAFDELASKYSDINMADRITAITGADGAVIAVEDMSETAVESAFDRLKHDDLFHKYSRRHAINGRAGCTLAVPSMAVGDRVRWHMISIGSEIDVHTPLWHGHSVEYRGRNVAAVGLLPSSMTTVDMATLHSGTWLFVDQTADHFLGGAKALFSVTGNDATIAVEDATEREYFIAADEVDWDYTPLGYNGCTGAAWTEDEAVFTQQGHHRIGSVYRKALYREYDDGTFESLRWGPESRYNRGSEHLGIVGPIIRGAVGDSITIVFRNNLPEAATLKPLGGPFVASYEAHNDVQRQLGPADAAAAVVPGGEVKILFTLGEDAGPGVEDTSSVAWMYGSDVDTIRDLHSGLAGAIIVARSSCPEATSDDDPEYESCVAGLPDSDGKPDDVDREFVMFWSTFDEGKSRYIQQNTLRYADEGETVNYNDPDFRESNKMHSVNGYLYCNMPGLFARQNNRIRLYTMAVGDHTGIHTPRLHGYTFNGKGRRYAVPELMPGQSRVLDFTTEYGGVWLGHCDVGDHSAAGMSFLFEVTQTIDGKN